MARARATTVLVVLASAAATTTLATDHPRMHSNHRAGITGFASLPTGVKAHVGTPDWGYIAPPRRSGSMRHGHDVHASSNEGARGDPGVFDVRVFGAVGDGVSDDTASFVAALAAATAAGGMYDTRAHRAENDALLICPIKLINARFL